MARPTYRGWRGDRLKSLREQAGCTQDQLALAIGAQPTMVSKWERGQVVPTAEYVAKLAAALDARPQDFTELDPASGSLVDLRVWSGRTRQQAAEATGISAYRLLSIEHTTTNPTRDEVQRLADAYGVSSQTVGWAWDRDHSNALVLPHR